MLSLTTQDWTCSLNGALYLQAQKHGGNRAVARAFRRLMPIPSLLQTCTQIRAKSNHNELLQGRKACRA